MGGGGKEGGTPRERFSAMSLALSLQFIKPASRHTEAAAGQQSRMPETDTAPLYPHPGQASRSAIMRKI